MNTDFMTFAVADAKTSAPEGAKTEQPSGLGALPMFLIAFGMIFLLMFLSQKKQQKQRKAMMDSIKVGDTVISAGGIFGKVAAIKDQSYVLEIANNVRIEISKAGVSSKVQQEEQAATEESK